MWQGVTFYSGMGRKRPDFYCASVNPVMVKWRWLVLRASISCVFTVLTETLINSSTQNTSQSIKHAKSKPTSVSFSVPNTSSLPHIYKFCALNSPYQHTIIYKHFIITITWFSLRGDVKFFFFVCFKSVTHQRDQNIWWEGACWQVFDRSCLVWSFLIHLSNSHHSKTTPCKAPRSLASQASSPGALSCADWQQGTAHERRLSNQSLLIEM